MENPLCSPPPLEVKLARSPILRVIAVIHFPAILRISEERGIIGFQEKIRKTYPQFIREQEIGVQLQVGPGGEMLPAQQVATNLWRFLPSDNSWRVTLSTEHVALETLTGYVSRDDFSARLDTILTVLADELDPSDCTRIGVRYLNAIDAEDLNDIKKWVRLGLRSLTDTEVLTHVESSNHAIEFNVPEGSLTARWGVLPAGTVHDASMMHPAEQRRWFLDLDCYSSKPRSFGGNEIVADCRARAERIYSFFRWAMTPEFIESRQNG